MDNINKIIAVQPFGMEDVDIMNTHHANEGSRMLIEKGEAILLRHFGKEAVDCGNWLIEEARIGSPTAIPSALVSKFCSVALCLCIH